jgi:hypothetical protein
MTDLTNIRAYADIRKLLAPDAFTQTMNFVSWHNRLKMTASLDLWKALTVGLACETKLLDSLQFSAAKRYLDREVTTVPEQIDECRTIAAGLQDYLSSKSAG